MSDNDDDQQGVISGEAVAQMVREAGIDCHVADTSGSTATLRVGPRYGTEDEPQYGVTMGPGYYDRATGQSWFVVDDITVGPPDDSVNPWVVGAWTERDVADLVVLCWMAPFHMVDVALLDAQGFDGSLRGRQRRAL